MEQIRSSPVRGRQLNPPFTEIGQPLDVAVKPGLITLVLGLQTDVPDLRESNTAATSHIGSTALGRLENTTSNPMASPRLSSNSSNSGPSTLPCLDISSSPSSSPDSL